MRIALCCALVALAMGAAGGASPAAGESASPAAGDDKVVVKIGWMGEIDNLNPLIGWTNNVYEIYGNEYLQMIGRDWDTNKPSDDGVAKSWEVSDDGLVWTFHMNEGLTWHDGEPVTAEDAAFTYNFIIEQQIANFAMFVAGVDHAEVVDEYTYKVICTTPVASTLSVWLACLPEHIFGEMSAKEATVKFQNDPPCIGNGPWQVVEWKRENFLRMEAYDDFFLGRPKPDEVMFVVYQNGDTMVQDFLAGNLDAIYMFPPAQFDEIKATEGVDVREYNFWNWDYVGFNCYDGSSGGHPALKDKDFRAALEYAIDRQEILDNAYSGHGIPGYTFMPPHTWSDPDYAWAPDDSMKRGYDPDRANEILDADYPDSDGNGVREYKGKDIKLRLWADQETPEAARACKLIAGWWKDVGIDVAFSVQDQGVYFDSIWGYKGNTFHPDFDAYYWEWDGYFDPGQTLTCFSPSQIEGWNEFSWDNEEYGRLDTLQAQEMDANRRAVYIWQMQQVMYEDCPCFVTVHPYKLQAYRTDRWDGWKLTGGPDGEYGPQQAFLTANMPWAYTDLTPKEAEEEGSSLGMWVAIVAGVVLVLAVVLWLVVRSRRGGPAEEG